jgi:hypothetical protein
VLARNTELGHRKKKKMGRWNCTGANQRAGWERGSIEDRTRTGYWEREKNKKRIRLSRWSWRWSNIIGKTLKMSHEALFSSMTWSGRMVRGSGARWHILRIQRG